MYPYFFLRTFVGLYPIQEIWLFIRGKHLSRKSVSWHSNHFSFPSTSFFSFQASSLLTKRGRYVRGGILLAYFLWSHSILWSHEKNLFRTIYTSSLIVIIFSASFNCRWDHILISCRNRIARTIFIQMRPTLIFTSSL